GVYARLIVTEFMRSGFEVLPWRLPKVSSLASTSMPWTILPNTGCCEGVLLSHQSRNELWAMFMKNWLPPELGRPVLAIDRFPVSSETLAAGRTSSWLLPLGGPPVPARGESASLE